MSLTQIGPIAVAIAVPEFSEEAAPDAHGLSPFAVRGLIAWATFRSLKDLVGNPDAQQTIAGRTGVLETLTFTGAEQAALTGLYLLHAITGGPAGPSHRKIARTPFSLTASYIGSP